MQAQAQLFGQQLTFSSFIPTQPAPTAEVQQVTEEIDTETQRGIKVEIEEKQERITELRKQLSNDEEALLDAPEYEIDIKLGESEGVDAPMSDEDVSNTRYENEEEIRYLQFEIEELEEKLA